MKGVVVAGLLIAALALRGGVAAAAAGDAVQAAGSALAPPGDAPPAAARAAAVPAGGAPAATQRPAALRDVAFEQRLDAQIPLDLPFRDEDGNAVTLGQYFGTKPVVLSLVYYRCPMLCGLVLEGMVRALKVLAFDVGKEFEVVTVSFDPAETPALASQKKASVLAGYDRAGAAAGWHFLTGDQAAITRLTDAVGFHYQYVPEERQFAHAAGIMILTPQGRLARYFYGVDYAPRDLRLGLIEAAQGKIGSPVDQLLLYCYRYDPVTGKYGAVAMNIIRLGGVATVLALGGFMAVMLRRERRRRGDAATDGQEGRG
jgi:protein SCO1